ncbi:MAG: hypothetical protein WC009_02565 [Methylotenera sp.]
MMDAAIAVAEDYLDNKPVRNRKPSINTAYRNAEFWSSLFLWELSIEGYDSQPLVLALARYLSQQQIANFELIQHIASVAPKAVRRAVRYSGIVLRQDSDRWKEIELIAVTDAAEFGEIVQICHAFQHAYRIRLDEVELHSRLVVDISTLELLIYASLYGFEHLIPKVFNPTSQEDGSENDTQNVWDAINNILIWKLHNCDDSDFQLTEDVIGRSLREHLSPFLFPSPELPKIREDIYSAFSYLVDAQLELNSFLEHSVDAFCYDDNIRFEYAENELVITVINEAGRRAWENNGEKFARLHNYWFYRAMDEFVASGMAMERIGSPENHNENQIAFIKAIRTKLQLTEVYGLNETILADTGLQVDVFQALLSLELMTAFYIKEYVRPYEKHLSEAGHWRPALATLAMDGMMQPIPQNRFPITFSDRATKIKSIRPWTVSEDFPQGLAKAAEAILDFWTNDLSGLSKQIRSGQSVLIPELHERPLLRVGRYFFQLPWVVAMQNNANTAINNLRRIGARRAEAREETDRIEQRLGKSLEDRGFNVRLNYHPAKSEDDNPGEIDVICARDGHILVLEIKSTYMRRSFKEAWLHKTTTLRKAGLQLCRKLKAVQSALISDEGLANSLGFKSADEVHSMQGWIVDTCIEHDHERFSGFLKVSLEEVLIALRDDSHLLNDPLGMFSNQGINLGNINLKETLTHTTLYPNGFSGKNFIDVIENQSVWVT